VCSEISSASNEIITCRCEVSDQVDSARGCDTRPFHDKVRHLELWRSAHGDRHEREDSVSRSVLEMLFLRLCVILGLAEGFCKLVAKIRKLFLAIALLY